MANELPLIPGTLPAPYTCYQALYEQMFSLGAAQGPTVTGILIQDATTAAEDHDKGWIPTAGGVPRYPGYVFVWHVNLGFWVSRHYIAPSDPSLRIYTGDITAIGTYDGGSAGIVQPASGPMWEIESLMEGRVPVGQGTIPNSSGVTIAQGATQDSSGASGEYKHSLTPDEMQHMHGVGQDPLLLPGGAADDPAIQLHRDWNSGTNSYTTSRNDMEAPGSHGYADGAAINNGIFGTTKALTDPDFPTVTGHNTMQPYKAVAFIKRTARQFIVAA